MLAGIGAELLGIALPAIGVGLLLLGEALEQRQQLLAAGQLAQAGSLGQQQAQVVGKKAQHLLRPGEDLGRIGIVVGQRAPGHEREGMVGVQGFHGAGGFLGLAAAMRLQGMIEPVEMVVKLLGRQ